MNRQQFHEEVQEMRDNASVVVRIYAQLRCPSVEQEEIQSILRALGDISIAEAFDALDRMEERKQGGSMSKEDPRPDKQSVPEKSGTDAASGGTTRPAEGGVGTDTKNDPANEPAAQPGKTSER